MTSGRKWSAVLAIAVAAIVWTASHGYSAEEPDQLRRSVTAAFEGRYQQAKILASSDASTQKLVDWIFFQRHWQKVDAPTLLDFIEANPNWPSTLSLERRAEQLLARGNVAPSAIVRHFTGREPLTTQGRLALGRAFWTLGDQQAASYWASKAWLEAEPSLENQVVSELGNLLREGDHEARFWRLIYMQDPASALRAARHLGGQYQQAAKVSQQLVALSAKPGLMQLKESLRDAPAMLYAVARYYRRIGQPDKAAAYLMRIRSVGDRTIAENVWSERRSVARLLLSDRYKSRWKVAYELAVGHGTGDGAFTAEGEFLAGWIALRFLKEADSAQKHFAQSAAVSRNTSDRARALYWLGRAYETLNARAQAIQAFGSAANAETLYYGQLAKEVLGKGEERILIGHVQTSPGVRARVQRNELIKAYRLLASAGYKDLLPGFLDAFIQRFKTEEELSVVAAIVWDTMGPHGAVSLAKKAGDREIDIEGWAFPLKALPLQAMNDQRVEQALVYGLARQESQFNPSAGSHAGARGLMQLMPGTAKMTAKQVGIPYKEARLLEPTYNVKLGSAHLAYLLEEFNGSYVLSLAAYNAGPNRAKEWVEVFGDPRSAGVSPVDWVEMIPITETRLYIQKVLQNTQVYRSRLTPEKVRGISKDLVRGKNQKISRADQSPSNICTKQSIAALIACE